EGIDRWGPVEAGDEMQAAAGNLCPVADNGIVAQGDSTGRHADGVVGLRRHVDATAVAAGAMVPGNGILQPPAEKAREDEAGDGSTAAPGAVSLERRTRVGMLMGTGVAADLGEHRTTVAAVGGLVRDERRAEYL